MSDDLDKLRRLVTVVVPPHRQRHEAVAEEFQAWCAALSEALAVFAPVLPYLNGAIEVENTWTGGTAKNQQGLRTVFAP